MSTIVTMNMLVTFIVMSLCRQMPKHSSLTYPWMDILSAKLVKGEENCSFKLQSLTRKESKLTYTNWSMCLTSSSKRFKLTVKLNLKVNIQRSLQLLRNSPSRVVWHTIDWLRKRRKNSNNIRSCCQIWERVRVSLSLSLSSSKIVLKVLPLHNKDREVCIVGVLILMSIVI